MSSARNTCISVRPETHANIQQLGASHGSAASAANWLINTQLDALADAAAVAAFVAHCKADKLGRFAAKQPKNRVPVWMSKALYARIRKSAKTKGWSHLRLIDHAIMAAIKAGVQ